MSFILFQGGILSGVIASVVVKKIKFIINRFDETQTLSEETAKTLLELDLHRRLIYYRLISSGVLVEIIDKTDGTKRYYMNKERLPLYFKHRKIRLQIIFGTLIIIIITLSLLL
jgi:hypothetical protein